MINETLITKFRFSNGLVVYPAGIVLLKEDDGIYSLIYIHHFIEGTWDRIIFSYVNSDGTLGEEITKPWNVDNVVGLPDGYNYESKILIIKK